MARRLVTQLLAATVPPCPLCLLLLLLLLESTESYGHNKGVTSCIYNLAFTPQPAKPAITCTGILLEMAGNIAAHSTIIYLEQITSRLSRERTIYKITSASTLTNLPGERAEIGRLSALAC